MKYSVLFFLFLLLMFPLVSARVQYVTLPYKNTLLPNVVAGNVNVNFYVKDSNGNPLPQSLIIVQGISNQGFSENLITDGNGFASVSLSSNEIFVYTIYKFTFQTSTGNFFTSSNKDINIFLEKIPKDQWYFYYENNGDLEIQLESPDSDVNYIPGEYINQSMQITNVAGTNIKLIPDETSVVTVDSQTLDRLGWWGNILSYEVNMELTLKPGGWLKASVNGNHFEACMGNAFGSYKGQVFDVSGSEFVCKEDNGGARPQNLVPDWILNDTYKFNTTIGYEINNQEKSYGLLTQDVFIRNNEWKPNISSFPSTNLILNQDWSYEINPKYRSGFVNYRLINSPSGMTIDSTNGVISWEPSVSGDYDVTVRAYHTYFLGDSVEAYRDQSFVLDVINPNSNLYIDGLYLDNTTLKIGQTVHGKFTVHNNDDKTNSFLYKIDKGDGTSFEYWVNNLSANGKRNVYTSWDYSDSGIFTPKVTLDPNNVIPESNEEDNTLNFKEVSVN